MFLHWSWFVIAAYEVTSRTSHYSSPVWNVVEYLSLFLIVLLHEFGHSLACRQVGGTANQIVLWPLGGVAYVSPPPRPGATLWSIAAGPLVNVMIAPVLFGLLMIAEPMGWDKSSPDAVKFLTSIAIINLGLLLLNLMPVYPLDGGQILRSLLWFWLGRARSLMVATMVGFVGVAALLAFAFLAGSVWYGIMAVFILLNCWGGLLHARALARAAAAPRHNGFACPACKAAPPEGSFWMCGKCKKSFDTFMAHAVCPHCATRFDVTGCLDCGAMSPFASWIVPGTPPPLPPQLPPLA